MCHQNVSQFFGCLSFRVLVCVWWFYSFCVSLLLPPCLGGDAFLIKLLGRAPFSYASVDHFSCVHFFADSFLPQLFTRIWLLTDGQRFNLSSFSAVCDRSGRVTTSYTRYGIDMHNEKIYLFIH